MVSSMRGPACQYSFDDLHLACFGRVMTDVERNALYALPQDGRNEVVGDWAREAGWKIDDVNGDDGVVYRSFMP